MLFRSPVAWPVAVPFLLLWSASPLVARAISVPWRASPTEPLTPADAQALRLIARRTWRFFSTFVGPEDHALPPDNFQESPSPVVAHRTSPTNMGLYLLSIVAAHDFGWLGALDAVERLEATLGAMSGLERFRGHFFNWYDTRDCRPLNPRYVSSVDSGNLAGQLLALKQACLEKIGRQSLGRAALLGIGDAALLVRDSARALDESRRPRTATRLPLDDALDTVTATLERVPETPAEWARRLAELAAQARTVSALARDLAEKDGAGAQAEVVLWARALGATIESHIRDLDVSEPLIDRLALLARSAQATVEAMEFAFLFDPMRQLFALGYRVEDGSLDSGRYDLLASEARLTSFVAIAKRDVPVSHWFRLGRALTPVEQDSALVSWSGSMFEYLMPGLEIGRASCRERV